MVLLEYGEATALCTSTTQQLPQLCCILATVFVQINLYLAAAAQLTTAVCKLTVVLVEQTSCCV